MIKRILLSISIIASLLLSLGLLGIGQAAAAPAHQAGLAQPVVASLFDGSKDAACGGAQSQEQNPISCDPKPASDTINKVITFGLNAISIIVGIAAVIMIMIGGFKYITSQGEAANTASARNTILYAIVGLVVVALAQFIVRFVLVKLFPAPPK